MAEFPPTQSVLLLGAELAGRSRQRNATVILAGRDAARLNEVADRAVLVMRQEGCGSIALRYSAAAQRRLPNHEAIAAAKTGVETLAQAHIQDRPGP